MYNILSVCLSSVLEIMSRHGWGHRKWTEAMGKEERKESKLVVPHIKQYIYGVMVVHVQRLGPVEMTHIKGNITYEVGMTVSTRHYVSQSHEHAWSRLMSFGREPNQPHDGMMACKN